MSSIARIVTSRENGKKGHGPVTPEGKDISSRNSTTHGLFSKQTPLQEKDQPLFERFSEYVHAALEPHGVSQAFYADHFIDQCWRLRDCLKLENGLFEYYRNYKGREGSAAVAYAHDASQANGLGRVSRYASLFERGIRKDLAELRKLKSRRTAPPTQTAAATALGELSTSNSNALIDPPSETQDAAGAPSPQLPAGAWPLLPGIFAEHVLLCDEDSDAFKRHLEDVTADWQPYNAIKGIFVELFAVTSWRLARYSRLEAELIEHYQRYENVDGGPLTAFVQDATELDCFSKLSTAESQLRSTLSSFLKELLTKNQ